MMFQNLWLLATALFTVVLADFDNSVHFTGDGTPNDSGQPAAATCGTNVGENYVTISSGQWNSTLRCNECVHIMCDDDRCGDMNAAKIAFIVDECVDCEDEGLSLSPTLFTAITGGSDFSPYTIKWKIITCPTSFDSLTTYMAGTVDAANENISNVSILDENEKQVENTSNTIDTTSEGSNASPGIGTILVVLAVLAAVCCAAFAAKAFFFSSKRKKLSSKRDNCTTRSFNTFSSPMQTKATIVKM